LASVDLLRNSSAGLAGDGSGSSIFTLHAMITQHAPGSRAMHGHSSATWPDENSLLPSDLSRCRQPASCKIALVQHPQNATLLAE
jgi:hypothetical protein